MILRKSYYIAQRACVARDKRGTCPCPCVFFSLYFAVEMYLWIFCLRCICMLVRSIEVHDYSRLLRVRLSLSVVCAREAMIISDFLSPDFSVSASSGSSPPLRLCVYVRLHCLHTCMHHISSPHHTSTGTWILVGEVSYRCSTTAAVPVVHGRLQRWLPPFLPPFLFPSLLNDAFFLRCFPRTSIASCPLNRTE